MGNVKQDKRSKIKYIIYDEKYKQVKHEASQFRFKSKANYILFSIDNFKPNDLEKLKVKVGKFLSGNMVNMKMGVTTSGHVELKTKRLSRTNWVFS